MRRAAGRRGDRRRRSACWASCVLALAVGMPVWLAGSGRRPSAPSSASQRRAQMHDGLLLVPLTATFAFISPSMLVIVMPLLALLPIGLLAARAAPFRCAACRSGTAGAGRIRARAATTALTFSNALRTFYSFIYRPTLETTRETTGARLLRHTAGLYARCRADLRTLSLCAARRGWCAPSPTGCASFSPDISISISR